MDKQYDIVRLRKEDDELIKQLVETAAEIHQRTEDSVDWLKWKYFGSPFGEAICVLAIKDGAIAGEVTFGKYQFLKNNKVHNCLISYQTMVHPKHQKKGLFTMLTRKVLDLGKKEGIDLVFNFPNKASFVPFERLEFTPINHLKNFVHFSYTPTTLFKLVSIKKPFYANKIDQVDPAELARLENLKDQIKPLSYGNIFTPNRTYDFLKWRYFTYPLYEYHIVQFPMGWCIIRLGKRGALREAQIMECFTQSSFSLDYTKQMKRAIKSTYKLDQVLLNVSENHPLAAPIKKAGFLSLPHSINFFTYPLNSKFKDDMKRENWVLTATEFHRY